ncbi:MAG: SagB/ThcOx family dehydrogenase [Nitrospiraceae bacterium]
MYRTVEPNLTCDPICEESPWEIFHENSKLGRHFSALSTEEVLEQVKKLHESLPFEGYPLIKLPRALARINVPLDEAIMARSSGREMVLSKLSLKELTTLLHYAYGIRRTGKRTSYPRPFRVVPSGGGLYPLEIFFHCAQVAGLQAGLYHYNPNRHHCRFLRSGDETGRLAQATAYPAFMSKANIIIFISALFQRSTFKYGDRGYRFTLLEAGHVAQNINLVSSALDLASVNIGGYFDAEIDEFLDLDGLLHSTVYMIAVGKKLDE